MQNAHALENIVKLRHTLDALFGPGSSRCVPKDVEFELSRKNGRIRSVYSAGRLLCTLRIDGGLAITVHLAKMLAKSKKFRENCCLTVDADSKPFVEEGRSVFCSHVVRCGTQVRIGSDVPILYRGRVIAVGKAVLSCKTIESMGRGVAVRTRDTLKRQAG